MKIIIIGTVDGHERYREAVDLGDGPLAQGEVLKKVWPARMKVLHQYDADYPFDPFAPNAAIDTGMPELKITYRSEYE